MLTQPGIRETFFTQERADKISASKVEYYRDHPEEVEAFRQRMLAHPSMDNPESRQKMIDTLKRIGHKPRIRGGNGTGPTAAEQILLSMLPNSINNYPVKTGKSHHSGYPQHYKVDVALPGIKLAVEADGSSHAACKRQFQDLKKTALLTELGWTVVRLSNRRILKNTETVRAELLSIILRLKDTQASA